jgi:hypothetical protein
VIAGCSKSDCFVGVLGYKSILDCRTIKYSKSDDLDESLRNSLVVILWFPIEFASRF